MKCERCVEQGTPSRVYEGYSTRTAMPTQSYYDEDGARHYHDPNGRCTTFSCSNGHRWWLESEMKCPSCSFGDSPAVLHYEDEPTNQGADQ